MSLFFYDPYFWLVFVIIAVTVLTIGFVIGMTVRRFTKAKYYLRRDLLLQLYGPTVTRLRPDEDIPKELKQPPGSLAWIIIEELLLNALENTVSPHKDYLTRVFEQLGYVDWYIKRLSRGNRWQQAIAAERLGQMKSRKAMEVLIAALDHSNLDVRTVAVRALGNLGDSKASEHLIRKLYKTPDKEQDVSLRVLKVSIIAFGSTIVPLLREGLHHESWKVRAAVADILTEISDPASTEDLRAALKDPEQDVRAKAARALGRLKDVQSIPLLIELLNDQSWVVRLQATRALGLLTHPRAIPSLLNRLQDENWQVRATAAEALRKHGMASLELLLTTITKTSDRYACEQLLEEIQRSELLDSCVNSLDDSVSERASVASSLISECIHHGMIRLPLHFMRIHPNATVRKKLLKLFAQYQTSQALDVIHWLVENDSDLNVRKMAEEISRDWTTLKSNLRESDTRSNG